MFVGVLCKVKHGYKESKNCFQRWKEFQKTYFEITLSLILILNASTLLPLALRRVLQSL